MAAVAEEQFLFENEEWLVTASGLEHKGTGYFIERESLGERRGDGLWAWPLHMAEKTWCAMAPFAEAFSCAVAVHRLEPDLDLARTFTIARREISSWPERSSQAVPSPLTTLQKRPADPIFGRRSHAEKHSGSDAFREISRSPRSRDLEGIRSFSAHTRLGPSRFDFAQPSGFRWRARQRIRKTGTKLVRMIQDAWNIQ
ncbi:hypothetical protein [Microvirga puerhi]|uniref:Uncharacterized protein n=1 Tax=Microvirga puerhi TaxID=2876078 RepID=A0ABS7VU52_9HYPH|nr:hypothetical protein [Microvirga puerhi]MBZ6078585.1 hypothetical protein [Microvirga puerhi]